MLVVIGIVRLSATDSLDDNSCSTAVLTRPVVDHPAPLANRVHILACASSSMRCLVAAFGAVGFELPWGVEPFVRMLSSSMLAD